MARYLIVANLTTESPTLRAEAARILEEDPDARFDVIVPMSVVPRAIALFTPIDGRVLRRERAARVWRRLHSVGAHQIAVHLARLEPLDEIDDVLSDGVFRAVVVSTLPHRLSRWLKTDLPGRIARRHPDVEVRVVTAPSDFYEDKDTTLVTR